MEIGEIISYVCTAIGSGGLGWVINWKWGRRKEAASVKADEIDNMRKAMADFYDPLVNKQNERIAQQDQRIAELEAEIKTSREERAKMERTYQDQIASLQKQITEITRALGIKAARQVRNNKGQFTSEVVEDPVYED